MSSLSYTRILTSALVCLCLLQESAMARVGREHTNGHRKLMQGVPGTAIDGEYLVLFEDSVAVNQMRQELDTIANGLVNPTGKQFKVMQQFRLGIHGFYITDMTQELLLVFLNSDIIQGVEEIVEVMATSTTPYWNLDRIDQVSPPLDGNYNLNSMYDGDGVDIYIFDTGAYGLTTAVDNVQVPTGNYVHPDFADRYTDCINFTFEDAGQCLTVDTRAAHGTHVAGIAGGTTFGVSKKANIVDYKVIKSTGFSHTGIVMSALNDVMEIKESNPSKKIVINMSLGFQIVAADAPYSALENMITTADAMGIVTVVAAGNNFLGDACRESPGRSPGALTVGAFDQQDDVAFYSSIGSCVDVYAPGTRVVSADENGLSRALSGSSMSAPHVAGAIANYMSAGVTDPVSLLLHDAILKTGTIDGDVKFLYTASINTDYPSIAPSEFPSGVPTVSPQPSSSPSGVPSDAPSASPSDIPSATPSSPPSAGPTESPAPSDAPSSGPTDVPSTPPSTSPSVSSAPSMFPSEPPSMAPTCLGVGDTCMSGDQCCGGGCIVTRTRIGAPRTGRCNQTPTPTADPSSTPSLSPTLEPTVSSAPSQTPSTLPTNVPSSQPTLSVEPSNVPSLFPTAACKITSERCFENNQSVGECCDGLGCIIRRGRGSCF